MVNIPVDNNLDFQLSQELIQVLLEKLASNPAAGNEGRVIANTTDNKAYYDNGSSFVDLTKQGTVTSVGGTSPISSSGGATPSISIAAASGATAGSMSVSHYNALANATSTPTANEIAKWDSNGRLDMNSQRITSVGTPTAANDAVTKAYVDATTTGKDFLKDVLDTQTDATLDPGVSPTTGDCYILTNVAALHANFGTITGVGNNDIVQYDGADFVIYFNADVDPEGATTWDQAANHYKKWDGTNWTEHGGLSGVTAGDGLSKNGNVMDVDLKANGGLVFESTELAVDLGASSITGTLAIADGGTGATSAAAVRKALSIPEELSQTITAGATTYTFNHGLNNLNVQFTVYDDANKAREFIQREIVDANNVKVTKATNFPASWRIVLHGVDKNP